MALIGHIGQSRLTHTGAMVMPVHRHGGLAGVIVTDCLSDEGHMGWLITVRMFRADGTVDPERVSCRHVRSGELKAGRIVAKARALTWAAE